MTDSEKACQKLPEKGPNSKLSKCQVFEISYKSNEMAKSMKNPGQVFFQ